MEIGAISHAAIEVQLNNPTGTALPDVTGALSGGIIGTRSEVSDINGRMVFRDLPPGTYTLTFALDGFAKAAREVTIHDTNEVDPLRVVLYPAD